MFGTKTIATELVPFGELEMARCWSLGSRITDVKKNDILFYFLADFINAIQSKERKKVFESSRVGNQDTKTTSIDISRLFLLLTMNIH